MPAIHEMIYQLAERGLGKSLAGEGSQESRAVALILSAIDQLATAAELDPSMFQSTQQAIDTLRKQIEIQSGKKSPLDEKPLPQNKEREREKEGDGEVDSHPKKEEENGRQSLD